VAKRAQREQAPGKPKRLARVRAMPARIIGRTAWIRRRYARRLIRMMEKSRDKGRPLPENLQQLDRQLQRLPKGKRQEALERMLEMSGQPEMTPSRELRRAGNRQDRRSGRGGGLRPGLGPNQRRRAP
jgi:hypothetical protein